MTRFAETIMLAIALDSAVAGGPAMFGMAESAPPAASTPVAAPTVKSSLTCREQWKRYRASQACFDRYRLVGGGLKPEAFKHCKQIPEPALCE